MFVRKSFVRLATIAVIAAAAAFAAAEAQATHFRYGTINWTRNPANPLEVTFNVTEAWRYQSFGQLVFDNGDGGSFATSTNRTEVGTFSSGGDAYTVYTSSITQTYSSASVFNLQASDCCRISTLHDGNSDQAFVLQATVDLTQPVSSNSGSPVIQAPITVPFLLNSQTVYQLPFVDPDNDAVTVSVSSSAQSGLITTLPSGLTVSPTGLLTWNPGALGLYAIQLHISENDSANSVPVDFLLEVNPSNFNAPFVDSQSITLEIGDVLSTIVTGGPGGLGATETWNLVGFIGLQGIQGFDNGSFDPSTQSLIWDTTGYAPGVYTFAISYDNGFGATIGQVVVNLTAATVGEPGALAVVGIGFAGLAWRRRRRRRAATAC